MQQRVGNYLHLLPEQRQARKVVWDAIDAAGRRVIDQVFPRQIRRSTNATEMKIETRNGSIWQLGGSDSYDSLVGTNPVGIVFSEYAIGDPRAWDFFRPILAENGGWALFIYTPRGRNHGASLFSMAQANPDWFAQRLAVPDTNAISEAAVEAERAAGMPEDLIQQEFYCSFDATVHGSYYGRLMQAAETDGRIAGVPYDPKAPVYTAWDLGIGDETAIWFVQAIGKEVRWIDYYEASGQGLDHYAQIVRGKSYGYGEHLLPHDAAARELGTGKSRLEVLQGLLVV